MLRWPRSAGQSQRSFAPAPVALPPAESEELRRARLVLLGIPLLAFLAVLEPVTDHLGNIRSESHGVAHYVVTTEVSVLWFAADAERDARRCGHGGDNVARDEGLFTSRHQRR